MLIGKKRTIVTTVALLLVAGGASATEPADDVIETRAQAIADPDEVNRTLARRAHEASVADAVAAVLADNALQLEIRIAGRTSGNTTGNTLASR